MKNIFDFDNYKKYVRFRIQQQPGKGRGVRSQLASAIQCQVSYLSRVLNDKTDLSIEQAHAVNQFFMHTPEEGHFFNLLVQKHRAGTESLRQYFDVQIQEILEKRLVLKERLRIKSTLSREDQATYYSAWYFAAIHMLISIPAFQTKEALSEATKLPLLQIHQVLDFLISIGLAQLKPNGRYDLGRTQLHLEKDSPLISKHHTNWRIQALQSLDRSEAGDTHYSVLIGVSKKDHQRIRELSVAFISELMEIVNASEQEVISCFNLDLFKI